MDRDVNLLSGGELQRFAIGTVCVQQADVYVPLRTPRTACRLANICVQLHV